MNNKYSKQVMQHFLHPQNVGKIKNPSGVGKIGNSVCGDIMEMTLKVEIRNPKFVCRGQIPLRGKIRNKPQIQNPKKLKSYLSEPDLASRDSLQPIIADAKFQTFGCGAAVATSSIVTELVKGKTINEAKKLTPKKIDQSLGNLPAMKKHCARLAIDALNKAIEDYESRIKN